MDGAFPQLKIAIEADGELFHSSPEQIQRDQQRDQALGGMGWVVLRFKEQDIKNNIKAIISTIHNYIVRRLNNSSNRQMVNRQMVNR